MRGPEVVVRRARAEDEQWLVGHGWHDSAMERVYTAPLLDKLGIRPGMRVAIVGDLDADDEADAFRAELRDGRATSPRAAPGRTPTSSFLLGGPLDELAMLEDLRTRIRPNGAIWVVSSKGKAATIRDVEVMAAGTGSRPHRQQGRRVLGVPDVDPARDPGRPSPDAAEARTIRT